MAGFLSWLRRLLADLKRRNVYRVAVTYLVVAFGILEGADLIFPATTLEGLYDKLVVVVVMGFPVAVVLAWAFELTPDGVRWTDADSSRQIDADDLPVEPVQGGQWTRWTGGALVLALFAVGGWWASGQMNGSRSIDGVHSKVQSIAILPFDALGQAEPSVFSEGVHDDLLTRLSNVSGLKVTARTSVQQYRGSGKRTREIAQELGVKWILEGGVQEMGGQIQVNAQLIDPRSETPTWAESYRRRLTAENLFAIQTEITRQITQSLEAQIGPGEARRIRQQPTQDLEAFRVYAQGRSRLDTRTEEGMTEAIAFFRRAIALDSTYALAWAGLADVMKLLSFYGYELPDMALPSSEEAARRALALDPDLAEAHASLGQKFMYSGQGAKAYRSLKRAVELRPSYAQAHHWLGWLLPPLGRLEEASQHASLAVELNPRHAAAAMVLAEVYLAAEKPEKALQEVRRARQMYPSYSASPMNESLILLHLGRLEEAKRSAEAGLARAAGVLSPRARVLLAIAHAVEGDTVEARRWLDRMRKEGDPPVFLGLAWSALGENDEAFEAFQRPEGFRSGWATTALRYWFPQALSSIREDARYEALIRDINRSWGLRPDGQIPPPKAAQDEYREDEGLDRAIQR